MTLRTRIDPRSTDNNKLIVKDTSGNTIAEIQILGNRSTLLEVITENGFHLEKENGWSSDFDLPDDLEIDLEPDL